MLASLGAEIDDLASPVTIQRHWSISGGSSESVLVMSSDDPAVLAVRPRDGRGLWVLFAFPLELDSTDLPLRPLMVPLLQEIVRAGRSLALGSESLRSGMRGYLGPSAAGGLLRAGDDARSTAIEIGAEGFTVLPIPAPGLWRVEQRDGKSRWVAVTLDPASASIEPVLASEIEAWRAVIGKWAWIDERDAVAGDIGPGESPWTMPLLVLALLLLVGESVWSRNSSPRPNPEATS
jgi:hypothetical protein